MQQLSDIKLDIPGDRANRATELMTELGPVENDLAQRVLGILAGHMFAAADRERIRQALRALAFCAASMIAATGARNARVVLDVYKRSIDDLIRQILGE